MEGLTAKVARRGERLIIRVLQAVRNAWSWLQVIGVELYNAWVRRSGCAAETPHSFSFKLRRDLSADEVSMLARQAGAADRAAPDAFDVFCLVKTFMADQRLQQAPVLVLPASHARRVSPAPSLIVPRADLSDKRKGELLAFARVLEKPCYGLHRAAGYLRGLAAHPLTYGGDQLPELRWLSRVSQPWAPLSFTGNAQFQHLPDVPWELKARFKRTAR